MNAQDENFSDKDRRRAGTRSWTYGLLGVVLISVFIAGLTVYGSGKFGWPVVVLVLAYVFYRYGPVR